MKRYRNRVTKRKQRMSVKQKRKILMLSVILAILLLLLALFLLTSKSVRRIGEQDLTLRQLSCFMSFYEYDETQWYRYFQEQGVEESVSWNDLEGFLQSLGVKEYLTYDRPKQDDIVTYGDFLPLYKQLLSLLDGDGTVKEKTLTVENTRSDKNEWNSGTLETKGASYQVLTSIGDYEKGTTCAVFILGKRILGISEILAQKQTGTDQIQKLSLQDDDRVTVLLKNGNSAYRDKVYLLLEGEYTRTGWKGTKKKLESGYLLKLTDCDVKTDPDEDRYLFLEPEDDSSRIYFADKNGKKLSLGYRGGFRVYRYKKGYVVVNELSIREYLYGVVPSEMPSSYEAEALKAQAVCARSYTYKHLMKKGSAGFYADLDDTVQYQVYNKSKDSKASRKAVEETADQVLWYGDEVAVTYYFSTSCGMTQGYDLWGLTKEESGYLEPVVVHEEPEELFAGKGADLSEEEDFRTFWKLGTEGFYEKDYRYFRWKATFNYKENAQGLKEAVMQRKKVAPASVIIKNEDGKTIVDVESLGKPKKITVKKRSRGGGITNLLIQYEKGSIELTTEYTIRYCLGACEPVVNLSDDSSIQPELLPSAWFYISSQKNGNIVLRGGGFGHGLGMSQNGANALAQEGWSYKDILQFFYHGVELVQTAK